MTNLYSIAGMRLAVTLPEGMKERFSFTPFRLPDEQRDAAPDFSVAVRPYDPDASPHPLVLLPEARMADDLVSEDVVNRLYLRDGTLIKRTAMREGDPRCMWSLLPIRPLTHTDVYIPSDWLDYEGVANAFLFEKMMLPHRALMLHCSLVDAGGAGIAFTAPSQTGKSTQARLWQEHRGAEVLNGDRAVLRAEADGVWAYGSPWAGSSNLFLQRRVKLAAIVALAQAPVNRCVPLSQQAMLPVFLMGTSLCMYDETLMDLGMDALGDILGGTRQFLLECTPDERAVEALEAALGAAAAAHV